MTNQNERLLAHSIYLEPHTWRGVVTVWCAPPMSFPCAYLLMREGSQDKTQTIPVVYSIMYPTSLPYRMFAMQMLWCYVNMYISTAQLTTPNGGLQTLFPRTGSRQCLLLPMRTESPTERCLTLTPQAICIGRSWRKAQGCRSGSGI